MKKRLLIAIISVVMTAALLTGCGDVGPFSFYRAERVHAYADLEDISEVGEAGETGDTVKAAGGTVDISIDEPSVRMAVGEPHKIVIQPKGSAVTWIAGLYRIEDISGIQVPVFTILTREPSEEIRFIHDRMPVILPREAVEKWIKPDSKPDEIIKEAMTDMVFEKIIA